MPEKTAEEQLKEIARYLLEAVADDFEEDCARAFALDMLCDFCTEDTQHTVQDAFEFALDSGIDSLAFIAICIAPDIKRLVTSMHNDKIKAFITDLNLSEDTRRAAESYCRRRGL